MVEFLVEHGADVNRGDKEGWTPLHATSSCGFVSIAKLVLSVNYIITVIMILSSYFQFNVINIWDVFLFIYTYFFGYTYLKYMEF